MIDLRDLIARALSAQTTCDGAPHPSELHYRQADAVLAVLADLPDDVIEKAADGIYDRAYSQELPEAPIDLASAALAAAFGGERGE